MNTPEARMLTTKEYEAMAANATAPVKRWTKVLMPNGTLDLVDNSEVMSRQKFWTVTALDYWIQFVEAWERGDEAEAKLYQGYSHRANKDRFGYPQ